MQAKRKRQTKHQKKTINKGPKTALSKANTARPRAICVEANKLLPPCNAASFASASARSVAAAAACALATSPIISESADPSRRRWRWPSTRRAIISSPSGSAPSSCPLVAVAPKSKRLARWREKNTRQDKTHRKSRPLRLPCRPYLRSRSHCRPCLWPTRQHERASRAGLPLQQPHMCATSGIGQITTHTRAHAQPPGT